MSAEVTIHVEHTSAGLWIWRAHLDRRRVAAGAGFKTRKAALIYAIVWLVKAGFDPR